MKKIGLISVLIAVVAAIVFWRKPIEPPAALEIHHEDRFHGDVRVDPFRWMHKADDPRVKKHLEAENRYGKAIVRKHRRLIKNLEKEYRSLRESRSKEILSITDRFQYYREKKASESYWRWYRRPKDSGSAQMLFDGNKAAAGKEYFNVLKFIPNKSEAQALLMLDFKGRNQGVPHLLDLKSGKLKTIEKELIWRGARWIDDHHLIFFGAAEEKEPYQVYWFDLKSQSRKLVHRFKDSNSRRGIKKTADSEFLLIEESGTRWNRTYRFNPEKIKLEVFAKKEAESKSFLDRNEHGWFRLTNRHVKSREILRKVGSKWKRVYRPKEGQISKFFLSRNFIVVRENFEGLESLRILNIQSGEVAKIESAFEELLSYREVIPDYENDGLFFEARGWVVPRETRFCWLKKCEVKIVIRPDKGNFQVSDYVSRRITVKARDGVQIPVSLIYRKDTFTGKNQYVKLKGYGAYGNSNLPRFRTKEIPLLDRGLVYAVAHIRGGGELGDEWHDAGRYFNKKRTFFDFIDVAESFIQSGFTSPDRLGIEGRSGGGLLMGAVLNLKSELFRVAIVGVPFVDVLNTMTLYYDPLAKYERKEWGDGLVKEEYESIKAWDPYTNIKTQKHPSILVFTGFEDTGVYYFQPMKWVAKMRKLNPWSPEKNPLVFFTSFKSGHMGDSDVSTKEKTHARNMGFLLGELGFKE